jgi:hypothetical protein
MISVGHAGLNAPEHHVHRSVTSALQLILHGNTQLQEYLQLAFTSIGSRIDELASPRHQFDTVEANIAQIAQTERS